MKTDQVPQTRQLAAIMPAHRSFNEGGFTEFTVALDRNQDA